MVRIQKRYYVLIVVAILVLYIVVRDFSNSSSFEIIKNTENAEVFAEKEPQALTEEGNRVNINTADSAELMTIPGIGEKTAQIIIAYREKNGAFEVVEDILKIQGIGDKKFETMKDSICVE